MNLVFINYVHPDHPHISAMRVRRFGDELARRGHRVVLLTRTLRPGDPGDRPEALEAALAGHDWSRPFRLAAAPAEKPLLAAARGDGGTGDARRAALSAPVRRAVIAWHYAVHGGLFGDWREGARPFHPVLARVFRPDAVWGTFGCTDAAWIGRELAAASGCAWCLDVKDNWEQFIPRLFRRWLARRLSGVAALTSNSRFMGDTFGRWAGREAVTVYSGVDGEGAPAAGPGNTGERLFFIGGSLYGGERFRRLLEGVALWWEENPGQRAGFRLLYAGADHRLAAETLAEGGYAFPHEVAAYLPVEEFLALGRRAAVNAYTWSPLTFHHKALELAAQGRPVLAFPGEHAETEELVRRMGGRLRGCHSPRAVAGALADWMTGPAAPAAPPDAAPWSWRAQARILEDALAKAAAGRRRAP